MSDVERLLDGAFAEVRAHVAEQPDLFARVNRSLDDAAARRRFRVRLAAWLASVSAALAALAAILSLDHGRFRMRWWVVELVTDLVLIALAVGLGPFIKRFGRSYAADVFRANPRTGKSYLVLTDIAYYLIFASFVLFTVSFEQPDNWKRGIGAQLKGEVARVGGILLIMGVLHAANVVALPVIGRLLSSNRRYDDGPPKRPAADEGRPVHADLPTTGVPPLGPGTWIVRVEPGTGAPPAGAPAAARLPEESGG